MVLLKLLGSDIARARYQRKVIDFFFANDMMILHMSRQTGKSYLASVLCAVYVLCGLTVVIAFPTLKGGKGVLLLEVQNRLKSLSRYFPSLLSMLKNNQDGILCANGGRVVILTTSKEAKSNVGFSASLIIIDEAHKSPKEIWNDIYPITFAQDDSNVRVILSGVGGYQDSLISAMKKQNFSVLTITGEDIAKLYPPYRLKIAKAKQFMTAEQYDSEILCKDIRSGQRMIFDEISDHLDENVKKSRPLKYAGIDVGWSGDETIVTIMDVYAGGNEIVDYMTVKGDWDHQAYEIVQFLRGKQVPEPYTMIERNAIGHALILAMEKYSCNYNSFQITDISKRYLINMARLSFMKNELAVVPDFYRNHLLSLSVTLQNDGKIKWDHSDYLSSLLMTICNLIYA
jgi:hypothetical protein